MSKPNRVFIAFVFPKKEEFLTGLRSKDCKNPDQYALIGGKIDTGENALDAAVRELKEECGITLSTSALHNLVYDTFVVSRKNKSVTFLECDSSKLNRPFNLSKEIVQYKWFGFETTSKNLHYSTKLWLSTRKNLVENQLDF